MRALPGQQVCGDRYLLKTSGSTVLAAVVDGLGHGDGASAAAGVAVSTLERDPADSVLELVKHCHEALLPTRGAVMTIASYSATARTLRWIGIGNVEGRLLRVNPHGPGAAERILLRGGVVGGQLPALQAAPLPVTPGDLLVLASDGLRPEVPVRGAFQETPHRIAQQVLAEGFRGTDDALVLVVRYLAADTP